MTKEEKEYKMLDDAAKEYEEAVKTLDDPTSDSVSRAKAQIVVDKQKKFWDNVEDKLAAIDEIDDPDEREAAWEAWEKAELAGK